MSTGRIIDARILAGMRLQMAERDARLASGEARLGWKAGFGASAALEKFQLDGPLVGYLLRSGRRDSGATVSLAGWSNPVAEPEIAVVMGADLAPGADEGTARAAIAGIAPAFELVDLTFPPEDVERVLAANIYQRNVVLGPIDRTRTGARIDGLAAHVLANGTEVAATGDLEANTGRIIDVVRRVAVMTGQFADGLRAGEVVITGSVVPPIPIKPETRTLTFRLGGAGQVEVRLVRD